MMVSSRGEGGKEHELEKHGGSWGEELAIVDDDCEFSSILFVFYFVYLVRVV